MLENSVERRLKQLRIKGAEIVSVAISELEDIENEGNPSKKRNTLAALIVFKDYK